ncbi:hypothetical protein OBBRIDRAFT_190153 [Obba rivulosa]|uniref:Uncharacterized protein n=1 Tax=Obba rivulosa TaxID=1052685 RepID=A0A8E2AUH0_9APHY|nr:hypothetical protein OBBRIDRAFT_190153 [Obba rivulosa]
MHLPAQHQTKPQEPSMTASNTIVMLTDVLAHVGALEDLDIYISQELLKAHPMLVTTRTSLSSLRSLRLGYGCGPDHIETVRQLQSLPKELEVSFEDTMISYPNVAQVLGRLRDCVEVLQLGGIAYLDLNSSLHFHRVAAYTICNSPCETSHTISELSFIYSPKLPTWLSNTVARSTRTSR